MQRFLAVLTLCVWLLGTVGAAADDTDVYGVTTTSVKPNVLIIFDNSGSMAEKDVPGEYYDPERTYAGSYNAAAVYQKTTSWGKSVYSLLLDDVSKIKCATDRAKVENVGYALNAYPNNSNCKSGGKYDLFMGNWLNYDASGLGTLRTRLEVAKEVIGNLIDTTENVNFGLMVFNFEQGGRVVCPIGSSKSNLKAEVNKVKAENWTPLAETLAEAGLYFAGKQSWYNTGKYTSPIQYTCQKNYIILMTDGEPTHDDDSRLWKTPYICGDVIGDYDNDGKETGRTLPVYYGPAVDRGTHYLDDVAAYLYQNDIRSDLGKAGEPFERQNVITYTIGYRVANELLESTAANGGGKYYTANSISGLSAAFEEILGEIADVNSVFVAPVVPVSRMSRTFAGNNIYIGFFKPRLDGRWLGNIKKYGLDGKGQLIDVNGALATLKNGEIQDNAQSWWSTTRDGAGVTKGGLGDLLTKRATRSLYTYLGANASLTHSSNKFATTNTGLTQERLGVDSDVKREAVINDIHGKNHDWSMGDIVHSEPVIVHYDDGETLIFAGSNHGVMHCFRDSDGKELWGFIPPGQLDRLQNLSDEDPAHEYFTDGSAKVHTLGNRKILFFGERRGSHLYYALDVTDYNNPEWLYQVEPSILGGGAALLGQSWGGSRSVKIKSGGTEKTVVLLPGGYDTNQDKASPATNDAVGRAVFALNIADGSLADFNFNVANFAEMKNCITDVVGLDSDGDGLVNRIYAPDLKGRLFAFEDDDKDGTWNGRKLFSASTVGGQRKMFYAPDAAAYMTTSTSVGEILFFGTGDRENPSSISVVNRFYAVKNDWEEESQDLTESDLYDATDNLIQMGGEEERKLAKTALRAAKGWFFDLPNEGEKVVASPIVYGGVVYFTTYSPETEGPAADDPCAVAGGRGTARLYAVDYLTGAAVMDYSDEDEVDGDGNEIGSKGASAFGLKDRSKIIGTSIPSAPVIAILEGGPKLFVGVEGGVSRENVRPKADMQSYFWREVNTK